MRVVFLFFMTIVQIFGEERLKCAYGDSIVKIEQNFIYIKDGSRLIYDDKKEKTKEELLEYGDIEDSLQVKYPALKPLHVKRDDGSRIRNNKLFMKLYGQNQKEIQNNLTKVIWLPKNLNKTLLFNKRQGAANALQKVSKELDKLDKKYLPFLQNIGGTFNYRIIANTSRLSMHSFGIAIDINVAKGNYWLWSRKYQNKIPQTIVHIFEKHGFIWGGRWEHFDTMHFEYRPELIFTCKN